MGCVNSNFGRVRKGKPSKSKAKEQVPKRGGGSDENSGNTTRDLVNNANNEITTTTTAAPVGSIIGIGDGELTKLMNSRQHTHQRNAREEIDSKSRAIEAKAVERSMHDPLYPSRPYGLAEEMEGSRRHIWDMIFAHVYDLDTIVNLRQVCMMFRDLVERKYVAARLPEVVSVCLELTPILWKSKEVKTLSNLRTLSKATKNTVDILFNRGILGLGQAGSDSNEWFCDNDPQYITEEWKLPTLTVRAADIGQRKLDKILKTLRESSRITFSIAAITFNEYGNVDLEAYRSSFQKCLEIMGYKITSFRYEVNGDLLDLYKNLRKYVACMPNLEELILEVFGFDERTPSKVLPFPTCHNLQRFVEGANWIGYPYIHEILKANPTITEVMLGHPCYSNRQADSLNNVLNTLQLTKFHWTCTPGLWFLNIRISTYTMTLTTLALWEWFNDSRSTQDIPSKTVFDFISKCKNLKTLLLSSLHIQDTGGYINLPELEDIHWKMLPNFTSLEFLKPVEKLKSLALDLSSCPADFKEKEKVMQFLRGWHLPNLFPALRVIRMKTEEFGEYNKLWNRSIGSLE